MQPTLTHQEKLQRAADDSGAYFRYMMEFIDFTEDDTLAIKQSGLVIEKNLPSIVSDFYEHLLRYPPTRKFFIKADGALDQDYLQKRMFHLTNFWRRTAGGEFDDDFARYIDYVGRAHTARGADPGIYIAERYVIGQVGFLQHAIIEALVRELAEWDPELERRAVQAWNKLMMVILEMLSRAYGDEHDAPYLERHAVDEEAMQNLAVQTYEAGLGMERPRPVLEERVAREAEIPNGERKIVEVSGVSIGVFHHNDNWYALRNHCLHRGGPVATGCLEGETLTCPWHGFEYNVTTGAMLKDPSSRLEMYPVKIRDGEVYISVPAPAEA